MLPLPARFAAIILSFAPLFVHRSWQHAQVLLIGAILAPGRRTLASLLRVTGRSRERRFVNYHRVLTAVWRHGGLPVVPIRWVLIRDPDHRFKPQALLCTDLAQDPAQIVSLCGAGASRSPSGRFAPTSASKRSGNGRTAPRPAATRPRRRPR